MTTTVFSQVKEIAADLFYVPAESITESTSSRDIEAWDSLQQLNLVVALEQQFGLEFEPEEIEQMDSIGAISALIERRMGGEA